MSADETGETMETKPLPEYAEWMGSAEWKEHLLGDHIVPVAGCIPCDQRPLMIDIHGAIFGHGPNGSLAAEIAWALQDGYGVIGMDVPQGWDWSGIRDSSPAAIKRIHDALEAERLVPA